MISTHLRRLSITLLATLIAACTAVPGGARLDRPGPDTSRGFHGLVPATQDASDTARARYIFVIHGMGQTRKEFSEPLLTAIAAQGYRRVTGPWQEVDLPHTYKVSGEAFACDASASTPPCAFRQFGSLRFDRFEAGSGSAARRIVIVTYYWEAAMNQVQQPFLKADLEDQGSAALNTALKHKIVDLGFGDATGYLGGTGSLARLGIEGAVCAMLKDAAGRPLDPTAPSVRCQFSDLTAEDAAAFREVEYSFVSFSLGSRMLYDVLSGVQTAQEPGASEGDRHVRAGLAARTRNFFMLANQMPLLGLGRVTVADASAADQGPAFVPGGPEIPEACARGFFSAAGCARGGKATSDAGSGVVPLAEGLEVVAFHDPEDLLGFRASGGLKEPGDTRFIEVRNRNANVWLGLIANPGKAHAAELDHKGSRNLILCGAAARASGALEAHTCVSG